MLRRSLLCLVLAGAGSTLAVQESAPAQLVRVEFGGLLWVQAADGLPVVRGGQVLAPVQALCHLFGAKCAVDAARKGIRVEQAGVTSNVAVSEVRRVDGRDVPFVSLRSMTEPLGFALTWSERTRRANVTRTRKVPGGLSWIQGDVAGLRLPGPEVRLAAPVSVWWEAVAGERTSGQVFVQAGSGVLGRVRPFHRMEHGQPGHSGMVDCQGTPGVCRLNVGRDWWYTLAYPVWGSVAQGSG